MVPSSSGHTPTEAELIVVHQRVVRQLAASQRLALFMPLVLLIGLAAAILIRLDHFIKVGSKQTLSLVMNKAPQALGPAANEAADAFKRLTPVYRKAINKVMVRDAEKIRAIANAQSAGFMEYARNTQDMTQMKFRDIFTRVVISVEGKLTVGMTSDEANEFESAAAFALYKRVGQEIQTNWSRHMDLVGKVCGELYSIAASNPKTKDATPTVVMGVGLELMGRKLQGIK